MDLAFASSGPIVRMAERSKALRSGRSPLLWAWVRIPLLTSVFLPKLHCHCCISSYWFTLVWSFKLKNSRVAQWKRAGPITQRSVDRNHALLRLFSLDQRQNKPQDPFIWGPKVLRKLTKHGLKPPQFGFKFAEKFTGVQNCALLRPFILNQCQCQSPISAVDSALDF